MAKRQMGRDHTAAGKPSGGSGSSQRDPHGRDYPHVGRFPSGGTIPTGPGGRNHPAAKGPDVPPTTNPFSDGNK